MTKKIIDIIHKCPLFAGVAEADYGRLLGCLSAQEKKYAKDETVMLSGDEVSQIGIVLKGRVVIIKEDMDGNSFILTELSIAEIFG